MATVGWKRLPPSRSRCSHGSNTCGATRGQDAQGAAPAPAEPRTLHALLVHQLGGP
jgi:hypothetical protein